MPSNMLAKCYRHVSGEYTGKVTLAKFVKDNLAVVLLVQCSGYYADPDIHPGFAAKGVRAEAAAKQVVDETQQLNKSCRLLWKRQRVRTWQRPIS